MKFHKWFKSQHKEVPLTAPKRAALERRVNSLRESLDKYQPLLDRDDMLNARYTSALCAWQAAIKLESESVRISSAVWVRGLGGEKEEIRLPWDERLSPCCSAPIKVVNGSPDFIGDRPGECSTVWAECSKCGKDV
jgi:hypothetical protein